MRITVLSGKGGVGKSMITSSLALLYSSQKHVTAIDCDVDAPNLAIWMGIDPLNDSNIEYEKKISTVKKPVINYEKCTGCGKCIETCNFRALKSETSNKPQLIKYKCEGCGLCAHVCPENAISMKPVDNCTLTHYKKSKKIDVIQGQIEPGEAESGEAVTEIRSYADDKIVKNNTLIVQDSAAGIGCPVIASIVGSDYVIAVTESSKASFSDLKRALDVVKKFGIDYGIVINKYNLNIELSQRIEKYANKKFLGKISYNPDIIKSVVKLKPVIETSPETTKEIEEIFNRLPTD